MEKGAIKRWLDDFGGAFPFHLSAAAAILPSLLPLHFFPNRMIALFPSRMIARFFSAPINSSSSSGGTLSAMPLLLLLPPLLLN
jgi:hypothetical protein